MTNCVEICTMRVGRYKWNLNCEEGQRRVKEVTSTVRVRASQERFLSEPQSHHFRQDLPGTTRAHPCKVVTTVNVYISAPTQSCGGPRPSSQDCRKLLMPLVPMKLKAGSCTEISSTQICTDKNWQHFGAKLKGQQPHRFPLASMRQVPSLHLLPVIHWARGQVFARKGRDYTKQKLSPDKQSLLFFCSLTYALSPWSSAAPSCPTAGPALCPCSHGLWQRGTQRPHHSVKPKARVCHKHQEKWDHRIYSSKPWKGHFGEKKKKGKKIT